MHYSSGIGNHFYYLLAEGSGAKTIGGRQHSSPTCNGSSVSGIGRDAAQKIWFRALTTYFTSGTTYAQARTGTLSAAKDLFGQGSTQYAAVPPRGARSTSADRPASAHDEQRPAPDVSGAGLRACGRGCRARA